jgi:hypothetical protein
MLGLTAMTRIQPGFIKAGKMTHTSNTPKTIAPAGVLLEAVTPGAS